MVEKNRGKIKGEEEIENDKKKWKAFFKKIKIHYGNNRKVYQFKKMTFFATIILEFKWKLFGVRFAFLFYYQNLVILGVFFFFVSKQL